MNGKKTKNVLLLNILLMIYSLGSVFSKFASAKPFLSLGFIAFYGIAILLLGVYAIGWQQVIKRMELTATFANKAITVAWGCLWGRLFFSEKISVTKIIGVSLVMVGIILYARSGAEACDE